MTDPAPQSQRLKDFQSFFIKQLKSACYKAAKSLPLEGLAQEDKDQWKYLTNQASTQIISHTEQEMEVIAQERDLATKLNNLDQALAAAGIQAPTPGGAGGSEGGDSSSSGWMAVARRANRAQLLQKKKHLLMKEKELVEAVTAREQELRRAYAAAESNTTEQQ